MKFDESTEEWISQEIGKIAYSLKLNNIIRFSLKREEAPENKSQSVAEHVYNMLILANYFKDLEDPENKMDFTKVTKMILMHDMVEIETGDIQTHFKNESHLKDEESALEIVVKNSVEFIASEIKYLCDEYNSVKSPEAKFVKAIDKIEAQFWIGKVCDIKMVKKTCSPADIAKNEIKRRKIYRDFGFKFIEKFGKALHEQAEKEGLLDGKVLTDFT